MSPTDPPPPNFPPPPPSDPGPGVPPVSGFKVGDALGWAWKKFQENAAMLIVGTLLLTVVAGVIYFVAYLLTNALFISEPSFDADTLEVTGGSGFIVSIFASALTSAIASIALYLFQANLIRASLKIADGGKPEIGELFQFQNVNKILVAAVLLAVGTFIGTILCYLPGLLFSIGAAYTLYFLIDKGEEPVESIKKSFRFVLDNLGQLILLFLASFAIVIVGAIACGVGLLVAIPVVILANAYAFRTLTAGNVAA